MFLQAREVWFPTLVMGLLNVGNPRLFPPVGVSWVGILHVLIQPDHPVHEPQLAADHQGQPEKNHTEVK